MPVRTTPPRTISLSDGTCIDISPLCSDDTAGLIRFHETLSPETVYRRYFMPHPHLAPAEAEHFCTLDGTDRFALAARCDGEIAGVARMDRLPLPSDTAEVAFVLADRFQHRGLGHVLAEMLLGAARERGVTTVVADTLADNMPMIHLLGDLGYPVRFEHEQGVVRLICQISSPQPDDASPTTPTVTPS